MKNLFPWIVIAAIVGGVAAGLYYYSQRADAPPPEVPIATRPPTEQAPPVPRVEPPLGHPLPPIQAQATEAKPLPSLGESDAVAGEALSTLVGQTAFAELLNGENLVRRIVVSVDNLPGPKMAQRQLPIRPVAGAFVTEGNGDSLVLSAKNSARYTPYVRLASAIDAKKLVATYVYFYPLFQQAYAELGYPSGYFNDRLISAIDNLIATPDIRAPIRLVQPKVLYEFADPDLEALSSGQKAMLRMGSDNAATVRAKLVDIRRELVAEPVKP